MLIAPSDDTLRSRSLLLAWGPRGGSKLSNRVYISYRTKDITSTDMNSTIIQADARMNHSCRDLPSISQKHLSCLALLLPTSPKVSSTERFGPSLLLLLLLRIQLLQLLRIQGSGIASLGPVDTLLARQITHTTQESFAGELSADAFGNAALYGVDVFVAGNVGFEILWWL